MFPNIFLLLLVAFVLLSPPYISVHFFTFRGVCSSSFLPLLFQEHNCFLALPGVCPRALLRDECLGNLCNVLHRLEKMTSNRTINIAC